MTTRIQFNYERLIDELRSFADFFGTFSDPASESPETIWRSLQSARESVPSGDSFEWVIAKEHPIRTRVSTNGEEGGEWNKAFGEFSMIWRLIQGKAPRKGKLPPDFTVLSACSVLKVKEIVLGAQREVAAWHFDIGDLDAPGCRLHAQFAVETELPRLPAPFVLPSDSLAFLANELFQRSWPTEIAGSASARFHGPRQGARLAAVLRSWAAAVSTGPDPFGSLWRFRDYSAPVAA
jgi:hypothetical protein